MEAISSLDSIFNKRLLNFVTIDQFKDISDKIEKLTANLNSLEKRASLNDIKKEFFSIKDIAKLVGKTEDTVRKKYIKTRLIRAYIPEGSKSYVIPCEEFQRVKERIQSRGPWALDA